MKVFITVTSVEPLSIHDKNAGKRARTPRVLIAGEFYDVQDDVAQKLFDLKRADEPGTPGVPTDDKEVQKQLDGADKRLTIKETKAVKTSGGNAQVNTLGDNVGGGKDDVKKVDDKPKSPKADKNAPNEDWDMEDLQAYAKKHKIDIKGARTKNAVLAKIEDAA